MFLIVNLSLNQTPLAFLLYVRQTWMTQLVQATSQLAEGKEKLKQEQEMYLPSKQCTVLSVQYGVNKIHQHV